MLEAHLLQDALEDFQFSSLLNYVLTSQRGYTSSKSTQRPKRSLQRWLSGSLLPPAGESTTQHEQNLTVLTSEGIGSLLFQICRQI